MLLGEAHAALGQDEEAVYYLRRATRLPMDETTPAVPGWPLVGPRGALPWLALARYFAGRDRIQEAEHVLQEGIQSLDPEAAIGLYTHLGLLLEDLGRLTEAHATLRQSYDGGGRSQELLTSLGRILRRLGHHQQAVAVLEEGATRPDATADTYHALSQALEQVDRQVEAAAAAHQAAALAPDDGQILYDAGRLALDGQDIHESAKLLQAAVEQLSQAPHAWHCLGKALQAGGRREEALDAFWTASRLAPSDMVIQRHIGQTCTALGQHETAITVLTEGVRRAPSDRPMTKALAGAMEAAGWWRTPANCGSNSSR